MSAAVNSVINNLSEMAGPIVEKMNTISHTVKVVVHAKTQRDMVESIRRPDHPANKE